MQILARCPKCEQPIRAEVDGAGQHIACSQCAWSRSVPATAVRDGGPGQCLLCGCDDLWRQKDFSQRLGLSMVVLAAVLSTIAWAYMWPLTAIGILMGFALLDLLLYALMADVLVCYRCAARYRHAHPSEEHPRFDLETAERYRQENKRRESMQNRESEGRKTASASGQVR